MKKVTVRTFDEAKATGEKLTMITCYDYSTAKLVDKSGIDSILIGDSLGMTMLGYEDTLSVTVEDMIHHSAAVAPVLAKLFHLVAPDRAYFGQKDVQQVAIVEAMVRDLNMDLAIVPCPIVREADGLAKSSRNRYLNSDERKAAVVLSRSIKMAKAMVRDGERNVAALLDAVTKEIEAEPLAKIDYVEILRFPHFERDAELVEDSFIAMAVYIGSTRLIDNSFFKDDLKN